MTIVFDLSPDTLPCWERDVHHSSVRLMKGQPMNPLSCWVPGKAYGLDARGDPRSRRHRADGPVAARVGIGVSPVDVVKASAVPAPIAVGIAASRIRCATWACGHHQRYRQWRFRQGLSSRLSIQLACPDALIGLGLWGCFAAEESPSTTRRRHREWLRAPRGAEPGRPQPPSGRRFSGCRLRSQADPCTRIASHSGRRHLR